MRPCLNPQPHLMLCCDSLFSSHAAFLFLSHVTYFSLKTWQVLTHSSFSSHNAQYLLILLESTLTVISSQRPFLITPSQGGQLFPVLRLCSLLTRVMVMLICLLVYSPRAGPISVLVSSFNIWGMKEARV